MPRGQGSMTQMCILGPTGSYKSLIPIMLAFIFKFFHVSPSLDNFWDEDIVILLFFSLCMVKIILAYKTHVLPL